MLTLFIGGNHEASNFLQELPYGGWVAPNIYYLGYAGVVTIGGIRIAGISGIYKGHDYLKGHFEIPPYNQGTMRSAYHIRNLEVFRLKQVYSIIFFLNTMKLKHL
jgi:lariat debranching enzyme